MILSAQSIRDRCDQPLKSRRLLDPFIDRTREHGVSAGLSPAGYDLRLVLEDDREEHWLAPREFLLAATVERFSMPPDLLGLVHDKSTWARRGLSVFNTVIEPGWSGYLTLELVNHGQNTIHLKRGMGIAQVVFHLLDHPTEEPYPKDAKYQNQPFGPVGPRS